MTMNRPSFRWNSLFFTCSVLASFVGALTSNMLLAADRSQSLPWPDKTGPTFDGRASPEDARGVPTVWDEATGKNVAWKVPLEGQGHSTPVIGEGKLWFTSATKDGREQFIEAIDMESGKVIHHRLLFKNEKPEPLGNEVNNYAAPSCALEPGAVYVHFGTYGTAKLDSKTGETIWERRDIKCRHFRGPASSPVLWSDLVILTFDGIDQQFLMALNKETGETVWRTDRSTDYGDLGPDGLPLREGDMRKSFSTPGLVEVAGKMQIVSVGSRAAFGYDARTGKEIWTITHDDYNATARPLFYKGMAILHTGSRGANLLAIRLDESTQGNVNETHIVWDRPRGNSGMAYPILLDNRIYTLTDTGVAMCINADTGEEMWTGRVGGTCIASPIIAGDHVYFFSGEGFSHVVKAEDKFEVVSRNELKSGIMASPAIANGALYLRSREYLYKISGNP